MRLVYTYLDRLSDYLEEAKTLNLLLTEILNSSFLIFMMHPTKRGVFRGNPKKIQMSTIYSMISIMKATMMVIKHLKMRLMNLILS